jgi:hypothetical protein
VKCVVDRVEQALDPILLYFRQEEQVDLICRRKSLMPTIKLSDRFGLNLDVNLNNSSSIVKYFRNLTRLRFSDLNAADLQNVTLDNFPLKSFQTGLSFEEPVEIGVDAAELTIGVGVGGNVRLLTADDGTLFGSDHYGDPIEISASRNYLGIGLTASVSAGLEGKTGDLSFGFDGSRDISLINYKPFEVKPSAPTFAFALGRTLSEYIIPGDLADLEGMSEGTVSTVEGTGTLMFSGSINLLSVANPLAVVSLPAPAGSLNVAAGSSIKVGASYAIRCEYQIRVQKLDGHKVRLGYYKKRGSEFKVTASAKAGLAAKAGNFDLIPQILQAISSDAKADQDALVAAGLSATQVEAIEAAIKAGIDRKLEVALALEFGSLDTQQAAFLYEIDLKMLDAKGSLAVHHALDGNLSHLTELENNLPAGVKMLRSILTTIRQKQYTFKVNLLGIYNYISISKLILKGTVLYEPTSGDLVITDKATASRIQATQVNFGADGEKLRRVLAENFLITAFYRCTRLVAKKPQLSVSHSYFELHAKTNHQTMKDNLDVAQALGLLQAKEKQDRVQGLDDFGRTTLYAETNYSESLVERLFLINGKPRAEEDYEGAGRKALALLVQPDDPDDYRRIPATNEELWKEMKAQGQFNLRPLFPKLTSQQVAVIDADYTVIRWWANAMRKLGEKLQEIDQFFATHPNPHPENNQFKSLRKRLAKDLASVAATTKSEFGDPWGLVAMDLLSGRQAEATVQISGSRLAFQSSRDLQIG